jgi:hypothetical protein
VSRSARSFFTRLFAPIRSRITLSGILLTEFLQGPPEDLFPISSIMSIFLLTSLGRYGRCSIKKRGSRCRERPVLHG